MERMSNFQKTMTTLLWLEFSLAFVHDDDGEMEIMVPVLMNLPNSFDGERRKRKDFFDGERRRSPLTTLTVTVSVDHATNGIVILQVDVHDATTMTVTHVMVHVRKAIATYHLRTILSYFSFPERMRMTILSYSVFHGGRRRISMLLPKMPYLGQKIVTCKEIVTDYVSRVILILLMHVHGDGAVTCSTSSA